MPAFARIERVGRAAAHQLEGLEGLARAAVEDDAFGVAAAEDRAVVLDEDERPRVQGLGEAAAQDADEGFADGHSPMETRAGRRW